MDARCDLGTLSTIRAISLRRRRVTESTIRLPRAVKAMRDLAAIGWGNRSRDESLGDEPVAHPCRGRGMHTEQVGEGTRVERAATGEDNQGAELRHRHIPVDADQRTRGDRHQDPRCVQHCINHVADLAAICSFL